MKFVKETVLLSAVALMAPFISWAQITNPINSPSLTALLNAIIDIIILIAVPIIVLAVIFAGFNFVTANGNEQKITDAKKILLWALVGGAILLGARVIADVVDTTVDNI